MSKVKVDKVNRTMRMDVKLVELIQEMADEDSRSWSSMATYLMKEAIKSKQIKKGK